MVRNPSNDPSSFRLIQSLAGFDPPAFLILSFKTEYIIGLTKLDSAMRAVASPCLTIAKGVVPLMPVLSDILLGALAPALPCLIDSNTSSSSIVTSPSKADLSCLNRLTILLNILRNGGVNSPGIFPVTSKPRLYNAEAYATSSSICLLGGIISIALAYFLSPKCLRTML